jgi:hypothetical protein
VLAIVPVMTPFKAKAVATLISSLLSMIAFIQTTTVSEEHTPHHFFLRQEMFAVMKKCLADSSFRSRYCEFN